MNTARVTGLRSVEFGVPNLTQSAAFYSAVWGLEPVVADGDSIHLRANGAEHHAVTLRERPAPALLGVHFAAANREAVDALYARLKALGVEVSAAAAELPRSAGGGYGFRFSTPEGHALNVSSDVSRHEIATKDRSKPNKLSHVVLNTADIDRQTAFFVDVLGFKLSDKTDMMEFVRCSADHHSIAMARGSGPSLNHCAYELENIDGLMRGAGRMQKHGFKVEWGIGRHGPGDNVFGYFIEPNGFVVEYTTEVEQVDEATYQPHDAEYWRNFPMRPCRWGMAGLPSNRFKAAAGGDLSVADAEAGRRCEEIMAKTLGR
ncbi:MAG: VOC family protein [Hyphomicrobiales bacterium]|nr:VOC family protein [Hyphomicrobiales bacterium]